MLPLCPYLYRRVCWFETWLYTVPHCLRAYRYKTLRDYVQGIQEGLVGYTPNLKFLFLSW